VYRGLRWLRPRTSRSGLKNPATGMEQQLLTEYVGYEREVCPIVVRVSDPKVQGFVQK